MKIVAIISSYRKNGHTSKIVSLIQKQMEKLNIKDNDSLEFEKLYLGDYEINHCKGCRACMEIGEEACPWKDDVPLIKSKIHDADGIIFASPVYVGDISSSMKALIDRLAYICHRQEFYQKCALLIATTNATSLKRTIHTMGAATFSWGFKVLGSKGFTTKSSLDSLESLKQRYSKSISKLARKLYFGIKMESFLNPSILSLAVFKIQQKHRANPELSNPVDYNYWEKKGWTDPKRTYYIQEHVGKGKEFVSKLLYGLISVFF